jgi:hypothetical protein
VARTDPAGTRALPLGGGQKLRRIYLAHLLLAVVAAVVILPFCWYATTTAWHDEEAPLLIMGSAVIAVAFLVLFAALLVGRAAIRSDTAVLGTAACSAKLAGIGAVTAYTGAVATALLAAFLAVNDVDAALVAGVALATATVVPAYLSGAARRLARNATGDHR